MKAIINFEVVCGLFTLPMQNNIVQNLESV